MGKMGGSGEGSVGWEGERLLGSFPSAREGTLWWTILDRPPEGTSH